jgi:spore maturation protein CgeB
MRILYFSDGYAWHVMGTKRSIAEEVRRRGHEVIYLDKGLIGDIKSLIFDHKPDQIWMVHTGLSFSEKIRKKIDVPIVGFGFSDPVYRIVDHKRFDVYITNHFETYKEVSKKMKCIYNPTACDLSFHQKINLRKTIDLLMIGTGTHSRFKNKKMRIQYVNKLRKDCSWNTSAYGKNWPKHLRNHGHIEGQPFLVAINSARLGLDIQDEISPLSHRMFEFGACGTPVITKHRPEVLMHLEKDKEVLTYNNYDDLLEQVKYYLSNPSKLEQIGTNVLERCVRDHNISNRVDHILAEL